MGSSRHYGTMLMYGCECCHPDFTQFWHANLQEPPLPHLASPLCSSSYAGAIIFSHLRSGNGCFCPCRSNHEQALIESFLKSDHKMLEWGSGYSTFWFSQFVGEYYAIEHNREWHQTMAPNVSDLPNTNLILSAVEAGHKVSSCLRTKS